MPAVIHGHPRLLDEPFEVLSHHHALRGGEVPGTQGLGPAVDDALGRDLVEGLRAGREQVQEPFLPSEDDAEVPLYEVGEASKTPAPWAVR